MTNILFFSSPGQPSLGVLESLDPLYYNVFHCHTVEDARRHTELNRIDVLLFAGSVDAFELARSDAAITDLPCIAFGSNATDRTAFIQAGADFYLPAASTQDDFEACFSRVETSLRKVEQLAYRDPLTGAFNRRYFDAMAPVLIKRAQHYQTPLVIALLDIDRFKQINDTYGHAFGDSVLIGLACLLEQHKRPADFVIRLGGEEFVILFPETDAEAAKREMNRLLQLVRETSLVEGSPYYCTFSAGVAKWHEGLSPGGWLKESDLLLYEAKRAGRNRIMGGGKDAERGLKSAAVLISCQTSERQHELQGLLKGKAGRVYVASTFNETQRVLHQELYDLVVMELEINDLDRVADIRSQYAGALMIVTRDKDPDLLSVINVGVDDCLVAPFTNEELLLRIERLAQKK
ncbi:GGDEF domain protein [Paenibacillus pasadenensis]|uniref:GGDEF domain protein n=1 Tax=Paenibacillus pasadenensis TaxID=217090 RepID=A0A2N5MZL4_9BACL|nr:diguanylate cyclase [Paenibacillus pasadenensis]PLT43527.1 GGDEF domain protein [Paenibacillus pasadenensis]